MRRAMRDLIGADVLARDGQVGSVLDVYFDDQQWVVRYLVVRPSGIDRTTPYLISPIAVDRIVEGGDLVLDVSSDQVRTAPGIEEHQPISRQLEQEYGEHYGWGPYWTGPSLWGHWATPIGLAGPPGAVGAAVPAEDVASGPGADETTRREAEARDTQRQADRNLRSALETQGYHVKASDGEIGHVEDFLVEEESWRINCLVVDTSNWWFGKKVTVATDRFTAIDWAERLIGTSLSCDEVRSSSEFDEEEPACGLTAA
jgi:sporulation protein YlmC with PRC-barrel domain